MSSSGEASPMHAVTADLVLFVVVDSEVQQLKKAALEFGFDFKRKKGRLGQYYDLGKVGTNRVVAVQTDMGPFGYGGSASRAIYYLAETQATGIIGLGMAFGVDPKKQQAGHILVSSGVLPYDYRKVTGDGKGGMLHDYTKVARFPSKDSLRALCEQAALSPEWQGRVHFGLFLSGAARIHCRSFRDQIVNSCQANGYGEYIIGGDMEGVGFLSSSPKEFPSWLLVKGISDFADEDRDAVIKSNRPTACYNAARFLLNALAI